MVLREQRLDRRSGGAGNDVSDALERFCVTEHGVACGPIDYGTASCRTSDEPLPLAVELGPDAGPGPGGGDGHFEDLRGSARVTRLGPPNQPLVASDLGKHGCQTVNPWLPQA